MKILVTGGAGFIGSAVCHHLVTTCGDTVLNLDKLTYAGNLASVSSLQGNARYHFEQVDITDIAAVGSAYQRFQPDAVLNLAAESHVDRSIADSAPFVMTNVVGTHVMLQAALSFWGALDAGAKAQFRFVQISTDEVYGSLGPTGLFSETTPYDPRSPYSASKAASDHLALAWHHTYGLPVIVSNCSNNYGPRQYPEKLIPLMILNALDGRPLPVYGNGSNIRDWLHVDDHAHALRLMLTSGVPGQKYNVGGRNERNNLEVVHAICDILDQLMPSQSGPRRALIQHVTDRLGHDQRYAIDASKIESELGWSATYDFDTGLRQTIDWYLNNADWWSPLRQAVKK